MLNGYVEQRIIGKRRPCNEQCQERWKQRFSIETAFLSILNRKPTSKEKSLVGNPHSKDRVQLYKDIVWVLVSSHEFLFIQ